MNKPHDQNLMMLGWSWSGVPSFIGKECDFNIFRNEFRVAVSQGDGNLRKYAGKCRLKMIYSGGI